MPDYSHNQHKHPEYFDQAQFYFQTLMKQTIYDFQGRVMVTHELGNVNLQIIETLWINQYPAGAYLIHAKTNNEIVTRGFVKL